jgi:hypothetical protein
MPASNPSAISPARNTYFRIVYPSFCHGFDPALNDRPLHFFLPEPLNEEDIDPMPKIPFIDYANNPRLNSLERDQKKWEPVLRPIAL